MLEKVSNCKGCRGCEFSKNQLDCQAHNKKAKLKLIRDEKWDYWGRMVIAFRKGTIVNGMAVVKDGKVYCVSAESPIYEGVHDFVNLQNVEILGKGE